MSFFERLAEVAQANDSLLCVGLDARPAALPLGWSVVDYNRHVIDQTSDLVCAYKPNIAFYEAAGPEGLAWLRDTIAHVPEPVPVILDAKRGDIASTAEAYASAAFDVLGADALTVSPYLGWDAVEPFLVRADRGVFVLCHTSNPRAGDIQDLECGGERVFERVARLAASSRYAARLGLVVGATYPDAIARVRALIPEPMWLLLPGVGAQGADLELSLSVALNGEGTGAVVNVGRAVYETPDPRSAAMAFRALISQARAKWRAGALPLTAGPTAAGLDAERS